MKTAIYKGKKYEIKPAKYVCRDENDEVCGFLSDGECEMKKQKRNAFMNCVVPEEVVFIELTNTRLETWWEATKDYYRRKFKKK